MKKIKFKKSGFTLIELLTVIAIIGILAAILIPSVGAVRTRAAMAASSSDMRQIALAHSNFQTDGARSRSIASGGWSTTSPQQANSAGDFAKVLAWFADLNDGALYFIGSSPDVSELERIPRVVLSGLGDDRTVDSDFTSGQDRISYEMARVAPNMQGSVTPLVWTKGLDSSGRWPDSAPWGVRGGHIVFAAGNVEWFESIDGNLRSAAAGTSTSDINAVFSETDRILRP